MAGSIQQEVRDFHLKKHPSHLEFLRRFLNGFSVTWGKKRKLYSSIYYEFFLKPEKHMSELFGFDQEILLLYAPYNVLEPRTLNAADRILSSDQPKKRVEKYTYFLLTNAENPQEWISAHELSNVEEKTIVAFNKDELIKNKGNDYYLRNILAEQLHGRDLFDYRLPLKSDVYFFGRKKIVMDYFHSAKRSENRGVFGLRKTGKTSLLYKIKRLIETDEEGIVIIYDGKNPLIRNLDWLSLISKITEDLHGYFKTTKSSKSTESKNSILSDFQNLIAFAKKRIVIIFDEIEYISPITTTDLHWKKDFVDFWQFMWSIQSNYNNLSFIIAGVNPHIVEVDTINNIQNPLFGIVPADYLKGMSTEDVKIMVKTLGKRMGLRFDSDTHNYLKHRYGGHPLLTRLACSYMNKTINERNFSRPYLITKEFLIETENIRDSHLMFYCRHVVSELKNFYSSEYELLEMLATGQIADFVEFDTFPEYTSHLYNYGLLQKDENDYPYFTIEAIKRYIGIESAREEGRKSIYKLIPENRRDKWLKDRVSSIIKDMRFLETLMTNENVKIYDFDVPEIDKLVSVSIVENESGFSSFINTLNRCFVESIENQKGTSFFWNDLRDKYYNLWDALLRIKVYRIYFMHLEINDQVKKYLDHYLKMDLENRRLHEVDEAYFRLQQATIESLFTAIQIEINNLD